VACGGLKPIPVIPLSVFLDPDHFFVPRALLEDSLARARLQRNQVLEPVPAGARSEGQQTSPRALPSTRPISRSLDKGLNREERAKHRNPGYAGLFDLRFLNIDVQSGLASSFHHPGRAFHQLKRPCILQERPMIIAELMRVFAASFTERTRLPMKHVTATLPFNDPSIRAVGTVFLVVGIFLFCYLAHALRTGGIRQMFLTISEFKERYFGREQTTEERQRSEREGCHPVMPLVGFLGAAGIIALGLAFLGVIPLS
jgi:cbb3-type cytochrome oxidase subunit 3